MVRARLAHLGPGVPVRHRRGRHRRTGVPYLLGPRPRRRAAGPHRLRRLARRASPAVARPARLPLRPLRDRGPAPAVGPPRGVRGRGRPAAARRGLRRPLRRRPVGHPGVPALVLDQEARAALHGGPRGRRHQRRRLDRRLPPVHGGPRRRAARRGRRADRRDRRLQPRRLRLDVDAARLAARPGRSLQRGRPGRRPGGGGGARGGPDPLRAATGPDPARDAAARPPGRHQAARALGRAAGRRPGRLVGAVPRP